MVASKFPSRQVAALARAAASASSKLSIATVLGLAVASLLPRETASPRPAETALSEAVPVREAPPIPDPPMPVAEVRAPVSILQVAARRSRGRRSPRRRAESGAFGKAGAAPPAKKTPAAPADAEAAATEPEPPPPDVWSDAEIVAALKDCLKRLAPLETEIEIAAPVKKERCGAPAPVLLKRIGSGAGSVEFRPAPMLNCAMVVSLHTWVEETLQPTAREFLDSPVVRIRNVSGYVCRNRVGGSLNSDRLSEHALANAIDIAGFVTADGRTVDVLKEWGPTARDLRERRERAAEAAAEAAAAAKAAEGEAAKAARAVAKAPRGEKRTQAKAEAERKKEEAERKREEADGLEAERRKVKLRTAEIGKLWRTLDVKAIPVSSSGEGSGDEEESADARTPTAEALFLRRLHKGACGTFGTVLGPEVNEAHRNHFHFDLIARKRRSYCR